MSQSHDDHEVPEHDVRRFIADTDNEPLTSYRSIEDARQDPDAAVVLSGDYGVTIFLTVPVRLVRCSLPLLQILVSGLDSVTWMSGDLTIATVALERHPVGSGVMGGDGGGLIVDGVWTHPVALPPDIACQAADVIRGPRQRIDVDLLRAFRQNELERKRERRHEPRQQSTHPRRLTLAWDFDISPPAVPFEYESGSDNRVAEHASEEVILMRPTLYSVDLASGGRVSTIAKPRDGDWLADEMFALARDGVQTVVSALSIHEVLDLNLGTERNLCESAGMRFVAIPIADRSVPEPGSVAAVLTELAGELGAGRHVVAHCRFGIGRSS